MIYTFYDSDFLPRSLRRIRGKVRDKQLWSNLPLEILLLIAAHLFLGDSVNFSIVCKAWNFASLTSSITITAKNQQNHSPWFLLYGQTSKCLFVSSSDKKFTVEIPELQETSCLASNYGWLLLFLNGFFFFFNPFSHAKIRLPIFPHEKLSDHVAVFSSPPTSDHCTVCVITRSSDSKLSIYLLHRGSTNWTKHYLYVPRSRIDNIKTAWFYHDTFYIFDNIASVVAFNISSPTCDLLELIPSTDIAPIDAIAVPFEFVADHLKKNKVRKQLQLSENNSISICGTIVDGDLIILNENNKGVDKNAKHQMKGVWILPWYEYIFPGYSWAD